MALTRRKIPTEQIPQDPADEWLSTHTLRDLRELAQEMSEQGEDVTELVAAVNELEEILAEVNAENPSEASPA
jgi:hypothetical protein